jgi:hypothetical protein
VEATRSVKPVGTEVPTLSGKTLSLRMGPRGFTRLTNGFSKKLDNRVVAVALDVVHNNRAPCCAAPVDPMKAARRYIGWFDHQP